MDRHLVFYFLFASFLAAQAAENNCSQERAGRIIKLLEEMPKAQPLIESTQLVYEIDYNQRPNLLDYVELVLNKGINDSKTYYRAANHDAFTCTIGKHSTTIMPIQLAEATCEKSKALSNVEEQRKCEHKAAGRDLECVWSGEPSLPPLTYGFWCADMINGSFRYPDDTCNAWRYKETTIYRLPVTDVYRPWSVPMLAYEPPECSHHPDYGDYCKKYTMEEISNLKERLPKERLHKDGRTGLRGRGMYWKPGGNAYQQVLVMRKQGTGDTQLLVERAGLSAGLLVLPMFPSRGMPFLFLLGRENRKRMLVGVYECMKAVFSNLTDASEKLYGGDMWDARNTDDAWLNMYSLVVKDEAFIDTIKHGADSRFTWLSINETVAQYFNKTLRGMFADEVAEKLSQRTGNITEKLVLLKQLDIVRRTIRTTNCASSFYPLVPLGLPVTDLLGLLASAVFYF